MTFEKLNKKILKIWLICTSLLFIILLGICVFTQCIEGIIIPLLIVEVVIMLFMVFLCFILPVMKYNRCTYAYNEQKIIIKKGVIFKYEIIIPVCQIQDLHLLQGPLMQIMKLQAIEISTAGSNYSISGIEFEKAKKMVDDLEENLNKRIEEIKNEEVF